MVELGYSEKYYLHDNEVLISKLLGECWNDWEIRDEH